MTRDEALAKVKDLWPEHELTGLPMSAMGVIKILEVLELVDFKEKKTTKVIVEEPKHDDAAHADKDAADLVAAQKKLEDAEKLKAVKEKKEAAKHK